MFEDGPGFVWAWVELAKRKDLIDLLKRHNSSPLCWDGQPVGLSLTAVTADGATATETSPTLPLHYTMVAPPQHTPKEPLENAKRASRSASIDPVRSKYTQPKPVPAATAKTSSEVRHIPQNGYVQKKWYNKKSSHSVNGGMSPYRPLQPSHNGALPKPLPMNQTGNIMSQRLVPLLTFRSCISQGIHLNLNSCAYRPPNRPIENGCLFCLLPAGLCCSQCGAAYCSGNCQMLDWPHHSRSCSQIP